MSSLSAQPDAVSSYGKQKYRIEKLFKAKNEVSVRSGLVIGDGGLLKQTVNFMKSKHVMPLIDGGKQPLQIIALYDLAAAIERLLVSADSGSYTIASPQPYTYRSVYRIIAEKLKIRVTFIPVPFIIPQTILRTVQILHLPFPVNEDNLLGLRKLRYQDTTADLQKLGLRVDDLETTLTKLTLKLK